jgi:hypothetical protein
MATSQDGTYTTELTEPVGFYLRGEEYSAQIDHFVGRVREGRIDGLNGFGSAAATDRVIAMMIADAGKGASTVAHGEDGEPAPAVAQRRRRLRLPRLIPQPAPLHVGKVETRKGS